MLEISLHHRARHRSQVLYSAVIQPGQVAADIAAIITQRIRRNAALYREMVQPRLRYIFECTHSCFRSAPVRRELNDVGRRVNGSSTLRVSLPPRKTA